MGIDWKMTRMPESIAELVEDEKEDENEGLWKPIARDKIEKDPELEKEIKRKDPEVAEELGIDTDDGLFQDGDDSFSMFG